MPRYSPEAQESRRQRNERLFLDAAREKFGSKFDYSRSDYLTQKRPISISCPAHGVFSQTPDKHLQSINGCPKCGVSVRSDLRIRDGRSRFEQSFQRKFGQTLELLSPYISVKDPISIRCRKHGNVYETTPDHLNIQTYSCPQCAAANRPTGRLEQTEFIEKVQAKFGDQFNLSKAVYTQMKARVTIGCVMHGDFNPKAVDFLNSTHGCPVCGKIYMGYSEHRIQRIQDGTAKQRPTIIALMRVEVFGIHAVKLGITSRNLMARYREALREIIFEATLDEVSALKLEQALHAKHFRYRDTRIFLAGLRSGSRWGGDSEIYKEECLVSLLRDLKEGVSAIGTNDPDYWTRQPTLMAPKLEIRKVQMIAGVYKTAKAVIRLDTLEVFPSATAAGVATKIWQTAISAVCRGSAGKANGIRFAYLSDYEAGSIPVFVSKSAGIGSHRAHAVRCIETNIVYQTMKAAQEATGVNSSKISMVCSGKRLSAGGFTWEYSEATQS
jgi:hypothetical protein